MSQSPWGLRWRASTLFIVFVVGIGIFTDLFLYAIVVPVFPFLLRDRLHIPDDKIQLYVSALLGGFGASSFLFSPVAGFIADRISNRQKPFLAGLVALLLSTLGLAFGQNVPILAVARVFQGISSAVVWTVGLAICLETVGPSKLGTTIGTIFSIVAVGTDAAPVLGGILYTKFEFWGVFAVCIGLILIDIGLRLLMIEKKTAARYLHIDEHGDSPANLDGAMANGEGSPLFPLKSSEDLSAYKITNASKFVTKVPILACFKNPSLITALSIGFLQAMLLGAFDATVPIVAYEYYGFDSLKAGLLFITLGLPTLIFGPIFGWMVDKYGPKFLATVGYAYLTMTLLLLRLVQSGGAEQVRIYAIILAFCSIGIAAIDAPSLVESSIVVEKYFQANPEFFGKMGPYAQLYGACSMVFSAGFTIGPLVGGFLNQHLGYGNMNAVLASCCALAAVCSFLFLGGKPKWRIWERENL
ncbi:Ammonium transporter 1 [Venturia nashicola]|uniref:Ammonium transporter 1 n=1 Tax=Venturia nashicola TaxID=86259 RepID=A0A4Z1PEK7_9PEZI|nr:Ammonium transporter 1 [Venturia nashicola]